jgi:hypothetical protein
MTLTDHDGTDWPRDELRTADCVWGDVPDVDEPTEHEKRQMREEGT